MIRFLVGEVVLGARGGQGPGSLEPSLGTDCGKNPTRPIPGGSQIQLKERPVKFSLPVAGGDSGLSGAGWGTCPAPRHLRLSNGPAHFSAPAPKPITAACPTRSPGVGR